MSSSQRLISDFYQEASRAVEPFNVFVKKHSLQRSTRPDHLCYKCGSSESFESIRAMLERESDYLFQSIISKRRIAYLKMKQSFETALGPVYFLELADQKPDQSQVEAFDHVEVYPTTMSYDAFVTELEKTERVLKVERPHHTTHDIDLGGFLFRCTRESLLDKIKRVEML